MMQLFLHIPNSDIVDFRKENSYDAHQAIKHDKAILHKRILEAMRLMGRCGTFRQIATVAELKDMQVWKRLSELEKMGLVETCGKIKWVTIYLLKQGIFRKGVNCE